MVKVNVLASKFRVIPTVNFAYYKKANEEGWAIGIPVHRAADVLVLFVFFPPQYKEDGCFTGLVH